MLHFAEMHGRMRRDVRGAFRRGVWPHFIHFVQKALPYFART